MGPRPVAERPCASWPLRLALATAGVVYAALASGLRTLTWPATVVVLVPAVAFVAAVAFGLRHPLPAPVPPRPRPVHRAVVLWCVLIGAGLLWEAWAFFHQPAWNVGSYTHPTLSVLVEPFLRHRPVRFAGWMVWLYAGARLAAR